MSTAQGDVSLLNDPVAQEMLTAAVPARLAYTWLDGTPRVVPVWFHWDGTAIVLGTPPRAPKLKALAARPEVAVTIDSNSYPYHVLSLRGRATVEMLDDLSSEYAAAAERYFGAEQGRAWADQLRGQPMARIRIVPDWVAILDFEHRLPSALSA
ncbi:nitroimidazol reductase NimA-like FMN-containing flavoprotein (pyridoxamine 5'-phosphate oxidase superfamily) [Microlunatus panaciterrae]|uniref:Nitroimidazol reductase NimA-like FMN-containing flavoprotein (Pyridoxamine 5'-phosphate oxidase superfamily) n=1 Tax=Microlunatus panaciterrae TaxID=400768 RepID=A0ABS2RMR8_9ACTN|nr:pyridoxamine 5'-phosphate oxidase family protein [Microlunatus panaciterrae]MBM7799968.1 nitroimidazol reductase NimA-like FMN-containing flavoprotein (pyridoxamine 5'-phosphate oxidase superfamily) [Microlunatus panaciterrae]